jgi:hypothetical protein
MERLRPKKFKTKEDYFNEFGSNTGVEGLTRLTVRQTSYMRAENDFKQQSDRFSARMEELQRKVTLYRNMQYD